MANQILMQVKNQTDLNKKIGVDIRNIHSSNEFRSGKHCWVEFVSLG